ncbi:MAG: ribokinase [Nitrospirota bacterium]|nr:ribokinase [Nitrospirota bacterium]
MTVGHLPARGETVIGHRFVQSFGGKGANQAVAAARAGARVAFLSKVGMDANGTLLEHHLAAQGLSHHVILRDEQAFTGVAMILVDRAGDNQIVVATGSNGRLTPDNIRQNASLMASAKVLLVQMEIPVETVREALTLAKRFGLITILNPAPAGPLPPDLLRWVDILTPNEGEAHALTGSTDMTEAARLLLTRGPGAVVVTCGADGALMSRGNGITQVPAFLVDTIDSTGAGDAFNGALACALMEGTPLETALEVANAAGALATTKSGAQESMPTKGEIALLCRSGIRRRLT